MRSLMTSKQAATPDAQVFTLKGPSLHPSLDRLKAAQTWCFYQERPADMSVSWLKESVGVEPPDRRRRQIQAAKSSKLHFYASEGD